MSKIKMRCIACGKWFQSANAKDVTCPDCMQKARKEKLATKSPPSTQSTKGQGTPGTASPTRPVSPPPKPKPAPTSQSHWLDSLQDIKVAQPDQPQHPKLPAAPQQRDQQSGTEPRGPGSYRENQNRSSGPNREGGSRGPGGYRENDYRTPPGGYRVIGGSGLPDTTPRPRQPSEGEPGRGPRPISGPPGDRKFHPGGKRDGKPAGKVKTPKPPPTPKPKKEKQPPPTPFVPTPEQIAQVENRYLELAQPAEFDGIRTQISQELGIPKTAVKKIIKELRDRQSIPSWWELQSYKGDEEELAKIKALYEPHLPLPDIGIHKQIAEQLSLKPGDVYQAIKKIRLDMNLPQFNDPTLHGIELKPRPEKRARAEQTEEGQTTTDEAPVTDATTETPATETTTELPVAETTAETVVPVVSEGTATEE